MFFEGATNLAPTSPSIPTSLATAMVCGYILNALRRAQTIPWVSHETVVMSGVIRLIMSGAATLGISFSWSSTDHTLLISGLTFATIVSGLWHWGSQYACQHGFEQILQIKANLNPQDPNPQPDNVVKAKAMDGK
jgi:hypothetical protein